MSSCFLDYLIPVINTKFRMRSFFELLYNESLLYLATCIYDLELNLILFFCRIDKCWSETIRFASAS